MLISQTGIIRTKRRESNTKQLRKRCQHCTFVQCAGFCGFVNDLLEDSVERNNSALQSHRGGLRTVIHLKLFQRVAHMKLDGYFCDIQSGGDFLVSEPLRDELYG